MVDIFREDRKSPAGKKGQWWSGSHISSNTYQKLMILVSKSNFCDNLNHYFRKIIIIFNFDGQFGSLVMTKNTSSNSYQKIKIFVSESLEPYHIL